MKPGWSYKPLPKVLLRVPSTKKIKKKEYLDSGKYPIVSQEEGVVNGYWNDENDLIRLRRPIVIFGDHNQVVKYIDFDFVRGADGTKILDLIPELEPRFFYYFLLANPIEAIGYARHFRFVKELEVPFPPLEEQRRIVAVLDQAFEGLDRARANTQANLNSARELFENSIHSMLENVSGDELSLQKMLDRKWILGHLDGNHGGDYPRKDEFKKSGVPYISANCVENGKINFGKSKYLSQERADGLRKGIAQNRDVLFAHNATVGPVAMLKTELPKVILSTSLTYYRCNLEHVIPEFLFFSLQSAGFISQYEAVMRQATRNQVPITKQRTFSHKIPKLSDQKNIAQRGLKIKASTDKLISQYSKKMKCLDQSRQSLLAKAFAGELT